MTKEDVQKKLSLATNSLIEVLAETKMMGESDLNDLLSLSKRPVGLRDSGMFNVAIDNVDTAKIKQLRRDLTDAISAEKWADGFIFAIQALSALGVI